MAPWRRIGWRNLGRNRKRTVLTSLGLSVGYVAVVFLIGWTEGITAELVDNATSLVGGQIEIHDRGYLPDRRLHDTLGGREGIAVAGLLDAAEADPAVVAAAPRTYGGGLVSNGETTVAGSLFGIDPPREIRLSRFLDPLVAGRLPEPGANEVVVGEEMARRLAASVGDELVVVASAADGSMGNDLFTVSGIFRTGLVDFDAGTAVMHIEDLGTLLALSPGRIHQIVVGSDDPKAAGSIAARLREALHAEDREMAVDSWIELNPVLHEYVALAGSLYGLIILVVFTMASFGVANTMLMSTFERRREFAVMLALGAGPRTIIATVLSEAAAIGAFSLALGGSVAFPLIVWFHAAPPSLAWLYGNVTMHGALLTPSLRAGIHFAGWMWATVGLLLTVLLAALVPAIRASRIPPADTLAGI